MKLSDVRMTRLCRDCGGKGIVRVPVRIPTEPSDDKSWKEFHECICGACGGTGQIQQKLSLSWDEAEPPQI
jgi:hypothetical protein